MLDDVHWADAESLRLLRRQATQLETLPLVVVVATRSAEAEIGPALAEALAALARRDPLRVELTGLGPEAIAAWVADHAGVAVTEEVAGALAERTDGNPFHVTELVRLLVREGALTSREAAAWRAVPGGSATSSGNGSPSWSPPRRGCWPSRRWSVAPSTSSSSAGPPAPGRPRSTTPSRPP